MAAVQKRIHELAKDYKISSNAMMTILKELGHGPKSHMSVATPEMIAAVNIKFAQERQEAKKEMEQKKLQGRLRKAGSGQQPGTSTARTPATPGTVGTTRSAGGTERGSSRLSTVADVQAAMREAEKKKKRKEKKKKRDRRDIDQSEVQKSFRQTMAVMTGGKGKKRTRRDDGDGAPIDPADFTKLEVAEFTSVSELAKMMDVKPVEVVGKLFTMGAMATINQRLDWDTIEMVASEFGYEVTQATDVAEEIRQEENAENLAPRAPVVTIMGHVDHGKTSLLDYIRKSNITSGEAGAITQHIGAYLIDHKTNRIVFLDTPGHEAFTAMRARGAQLTDIVVLVIAADEGMKPQTREAIDHARAASVPIIVAITKIDKPTANVDDVKRELSELNLLPEDWGGKTITVPLSAKSGEGVEELLDMILLQAETMELQADPEIRAQGVIVDARLEKGRGPVATVLIQRGNAKVGDPIVAGTHFGRIRTIMDDREQQLKEIGPSTPAQITGLAGVPQAGDTFLRVENEQEAREITLKRDQLKREQESRMVAAPVSLDKVFDRIQEGQIKEVRLIIKGDVDGSVEVLSDTLGKIATSEVKTTIIRQGVGGITESDVLLAAASEAIIIGFHVAPDSRAREIARQEKVDIRLYDIIYEAESDVRKALEGLLSPDVTEEMVGEAEVRQTFRVPKIGVIAGCYVVSGHFKRSHRVRLLRDGTVVYAGNLESLKRFKDDVKEVKEGFECGIGIENFNDIKVGDRIEALEVVETARTLEA